MWVIGRVDLVTPFGALAGGYRFPDAFQDGRWASVPDVRNVIPTIFWPSPASACLKNGWALCGFENYLAYLGGELQFIEALNEKLTDYSCQLTRQLKGMASMGSALATTGACSAP